MTKKVLADDESYLAELKESCTAKATEWSIRQKDAGEETAAIEKAKEILSTGVKVFLQTSSMTRTTDEDVEHAQRRAAAVRTLRGLAKKYNTFGLLELSMSAKSDPFGKVRGLIESMIAKLTKEAAEEADLKSFCDTETSESKAKQAELTAKLDKTNARIAKAVASKAKLTEDIKLLEEQVAETEAAESSAVAAYEALSEENKISKTTKMADAKGKANEVKSTDVALSNYKEDKTSLTGELDAVLAYLDKLKPQCETKVMSYAERKAKREAEIEGLKEALQVLSETALLQVKSSLRGVRRAL